MVGERETFLKLSYLQNDKQQDGRNTNVCLRIPLLVVINSWIGQAKIGKEVNYNIFTKYIQNNNSFKLFKHEKILIHSVSLLHFWSLSNGTKSTYIPWLAQ